MISRKRKLLKFCDQFIEFMHTMWKFWIEDKRWPVKVKTNFKGGRSLFDSENSKLSKSTEPFPQKNQEKSIYTFYDKVCKTEKGLESIKDSRSAAMFMKYALERPRDMINDFIRDNGDEIFL